MHRAGRILQKRVSTRCYYTNCFCPHCRILSALPGQAICDYLFVGVAVISVVLGVAFFAARPTRSFAQSLLSTVCLFFLGIIAVLEIVALRGNSIAVVSAKTAFNYLLEMSVVVRSSHSIYVFVIEKFRLKPQLTNHIISDTTVSGSGPRQETSSPSAADQPNDPTDNGNNNVTSTSAPGHFSSVKSLC